MGEFVNDIDITSLRHLLSTIEKNKSIDEFIILYEEAILH